MQIYSSDSLINKQGIKCLVYGRAGVGKTMLAATCPQPIILSAESGLLSLSGKNLPVIPIKNVNDLTNAHTWFERSNEAKQFKTIYIDSLTEIGEIVLSNAKTMCKDPRQAYGELMDKMTMVIKSFRDLVGFNVVMTAKEEPRTDDVSGLTKYYPAMPGRKLGPNLPYYFDEVFHMDIGREPKGGGHYRYLLTQPTFSNDAKDRSGRLAEKEQADLSLLFNKIQQGDL